MSRYYFDVRSRFGLDEDLNGVELPDLDAAHARALEVGRRLRERWTDLPADAERYIAIEVVDEGLRTAVRVPLSDVGGAPRPAASPMPSRLRLWLAALLTLRRLGRS